MGQCVCVCVFGRRRFVSISTLCLSVATRRMCGETEETLLLFIASDFVHFVGQLSFLFTISAMNDIRDRCGVLQCLRAIAIVFWPLLIWFCVNCLDLTPHSACNNTHVIDFKYSLIISAPCVCFNWNIQRERERAFCAHTQKVRHRCRDNAPTEYVNTPNG